MRSHIIDALWGNKEDVPLLKNFEPIVSPPNLLLNSKVKPGAVSALLPIQKGIFSLSKAPQPLND